MTRLPDNQKDALYILQRNPERWIRVNEFHCGPHGNSYAALVRKGLAERKIEKEIYYYRLRKPESS